MDAIAAGRLNQTNTYVLKTAIYYAQCSELCGINHSFIPISLEVVENNNFIT
jgi:heme/copper-type cytochrome/quinol oxidase subunit 2